MGQEQEEFEDPKLADLLREWAGDAKAGRAPLPPPGRSAGVNEIFEAVDSMERGIAHPPAAEPRLVRVAREAEETDFRPWEERGAGVPAKPRRQIILRLWPVAAAAAAVLVVGIGLWQIGKGRDQLDIGRIEQALNLRVGYSDSAVRGEPGLPPGKAYIYFTPPAGAYYSILLLNDELAVALFNPNDRPERAEEGGRYKVQWKLEGKPDRDITETIFIVVSETRWEGIDQFAIEIGPGLSGSREERIEHIKRAIHAAREDLAVTAKTYVVRSAVP
jgi:hypothetical protein